MSEPLVSVCMISYNQEKYIAQAIMSVLDQQCSFPIEIVLGDDCSSDRTLVIAKELAHGSPISIRIHSREQNLGMMRNAIKTYSECTGEYIAFLEGDDFWTDRSKLQRQVELLSSNRSHSMCFHKSEYVDADSQPLGRVHPAAGKPVYTIQDLIEENPIQTNTILLRRSAVTELPSFFQNLRLGDWPMCILAARVGNIAFIDRVMAAYRLHATSNWSTKLRSEHVNAEIEMLLYMAQHYQDLQPHVIERLTSHYLNRDRDIEALRSSISYRLGRLLLSPIRWARGG